MAGRGTPRSLVVAVVLSAVVAAGAVAGSAALRWRAVDAAGGLSSGQTAPDVDVSGCQVEPCQVLGTQTVGGTTIELVADAGAMSGRLRIGGLTSGRVIETTITDMGVALTPDSLQCYAAVIYACLVRGNLQAGSAGEVVVGRSEKWSALQRPYVSDAGYLALANVTEDSAPEVIAVQHDCAGAAPADCANRPVFAQVFALTGEEIGCTKSHPRIEQLPGYPVIHLTPAQLRPCS